MKRIATSILFSGALVFAVASASAATFTWTGSGSGNNADNWSAKQNWDPLKDAPPLAADDAVFGAIAPGDSTTPTVTDPASIGSVTFNDGTYSLTGTGTLTIGSGGLTVTDPASVTLSAALGFLPGGAINLNGGTVTLANNYSAPTTPVNFVGGTLNQGTSVSSFGTLNVDGAAVLNLGGVSGDITFSDATFTSGLLSINNWVGPAYDPELVNTGGTASKIFITSAPDSTFLANVQFSGANGPYALGATWLSTSGELVPVPEPTTYAVLFALALLGFAIVRRRMLAAA